MNFKNIELSNFNGYEIEETAVTELKLNVLKCVICVLI